MARVTKYSLDRHTHECSLEDLQAAFNNWLSTPGRIARIGSVPFFVTGISRPIKKILNKTASVDSVLFEGNLLRHGGRVHGFIDFQRKKGWVKVEYLKKPRESRCFSPEWVERVSKTKS